MSILSPVIPTDFSYMGHIHIWSVRYYQCTISLSLYNLN